MHCVLYVGEIQQRLSEEQMGVEGVGMDHMTQEPVPYFLLQAPVDNAAPVDVVGCGEPVEMTMSCVCMIHLSMGRRKFSCKTSCAASSVSAMYACFSPLPRAAQLGMILCAERGCARGQHRLRACFASSTIPCWCFCTSPSYFTRTTPVVND